MIKGIAIYIEGGGDTAQTIKPFRTGMSAFLKPFVDEVQKKRMNCRIIPCGARKEAYNAFVDALTNEPDFHNILLVDSEELPKTPSPWTHLLNRQGDGWRKPAGVNDEHCHMMVVCMEAWFLADPAALKQHYGGNFDASKLPSVNLAESRTKDDIAKALRQATRNTKAGEYRKIRDGANLLEKLNPIEVRKHCKWCDRLFRELAMVIG